MCVTGHFFFCLVYQFLDNNSRGARHNILPYVMFSPVNVLYKYFLFTILFQFNIGFTFQLVEDEALRPCKG